MARKTIEAVSFARVRLTISTPTGTQHKDVCREHAKQIIATQNVIREYKIATFGSSCEVCREAWERIIREFGA